MDAYILVQEISEFGQEVVLMDSSEWSINPGDISKTCCWYPFLIDVKLIAIN